MCCFSLGKTGHTLALLPFDCINALYAPVDNPESRCCKIPAGTVLFGQNFSRCFKDTTKGVALVMLYIDFMAVPDNRFCKSGNAC